MNNHNDQNMDSGSELKYKLLTENCSTLVNTTIFR